MEKTQKHIQGIPHLKKRAAMMLAGVMMIGVSVGVFRFTQLGTDPFTTLNLGISARIGMDFANWQLIINIFLLAVVLVLKRSLIGVGTIINMVGVGYASNFIVWVLQRLMPQANLAVRVIFLLIAFLATCLGVALYITADLGVAPYDALAIIVNDRSNNKISYRTARVIGDCASILMGVLFYWASGNPVSSLVGAGTVLTAFFTGPIVQWYVSHVAQPLLNKNK